MSKKISQLTELTTVLDADVLPVVNSGATKKVTKQNLLKEIVTALASKSDTSHNHDDRYYTEAEITALLAGKSDTSHNHDSRYYTETEIDALIAGMITQVDWGDISGTLADQGDLHTALNAKENTANKNIAGGYAGLDGAGKIFTTQLPALAISDTFVVNSQAQMLALTAQVGDVAVRTDLNKSFILRGSDPSQLSDWQELLTPTDAVTSVNGLTGVVSLTPGIIGAADGVHTHIKADITDFAHTHGSSDITDFTESVQDILAASLVEGSNITIEYDDITGEITISSTGGGGGLTDVVDDLTPQLGGDLDVNGNDIISASNGDIVIDPNGTGDILLKIADKFKVTDSSGVDKLVINDNGSTVFKNDGGGYGDSTEFTSTLSTAIVNINALTNNYAELGLSTQFYSGAYRLTTGGNFETRASSNVDFYIIGTSKYIARFNGTGLFIGSEATATDPTARLDLNGDKIRLRTAKTPASASATGNQGDICWDSDYLYVCTASNTWKRSAISTW